MIRSVLSVVLWLIPAIILAACANAPDPADAARQPASSGDDPEPPAAEVREESPLPTLSPSTLPTQTTAPFEMGTPPAVELPDLGPAPDITNEVWLNTDQPLNLTALRGRVVLIEFWTFG